MTLEELTEIQRTRGLEGRSELEANERPNSPQELEANQRPQELEVNPSNSGLPPRGFFSSSSLFSYYFNSFYSRPNSSESRANPNSNTVARGSNHTQVQNDNQDTSN